MAEFQRESKTFSQVLNFTRGTTGTYFDSAGVLQTAAVDEPRFTHDPVSLESLGLLIEEQRTNLLLWSEAFDDAVWAKNRISVTANTATAPDGQMSSDKLIPNTEDNSHFITKSFSAISGSATYTIHAKAGEYSAIRINSGSSGNGFATFDLALGVVSASSGTFFTSADIESIGDGWYRCTLVMTDTPGEVFTIAVENPVGDLIFAGDGASGVYIWGAQVEAGSFPTSYIKTEGSQVTRSADDCSRTLGSEFNASEGRIEVTATANVGDTVISLGSESIVADVDTEKTYTLTYNVDPSATTLDIMPGASGTVKSVKYSPRETA